MKRISSVSGKTQQPGIPSNGPYSTGSHCPVTGVWEDRNGTIRFIAEGAIFPSIAFGTSVWTLRKDQLRQD